MSHGHLFTKSVQRLAPGLAIPGRREGAHQYGCRLGPFMRLMYLTSDSGKSLAQLLRAIAGCSNDTMRWHAIPITTPCTSCSRPASNC